MEFFCKRHFSFLPHFLFMQQFISISIDSRVLILHFVLNTSDILFTLLIKIATEASFSCLLYPFDIPSIFIFLVTTFCFWHYKMFWGSFCIFPAPILESDISEKSWFPLLENCIQLIDLDCNQDQGLRCACCYRGVVACRHSRQSKQIYVLY